MERKILAPTTIEDGVHKGVIIDVLERETSQKYHYIDVLIEFEGGKKIKDSYSDYLSPESKLGRLLNRFGCDLSKIDTTIKIDQPLKNRTCQFMTNKKGKYSEVVEDSLKPIVPVQKDGMPGIPLPPGPEVKTNEENRTQNGNY